MTEKKLPCDIVRDAQVKLKRAGPWPYVVDEVIEEIDGAFWAVEWQRQDLLKVLAGNHLRLCTKYPEEWVLLEPGEIEFGQDPEKKYCPMCGGEDIDGKCVLPERED